MKKLGLLSLFLLPLLCKAETIAEYQFRAMEENYTVTIVDKNGNATGRNFTLFKDYVYQFVTILKKNDIHFMYIIHGYYVDYASYISARLKSTLMTVPQGDFPNLQ